MNLSTIRDIMNKGYITEKDLQVRIKCKCGSVAELHSKLSWDKQKLIYRCIECGNFHIEGKGWIL